MSMIFNFKPVGAPALSVVAQNDARFVRLGSGAPDVHIRPRPGGFTLIVSNGCFEGPSQPANGGKPVQGMLYVESGGVALVKKTVLDLGFGGAIPYRMGSAAKPDYAAPTSWDQYWLRNWPTDTVVSAKLQQLYQDVAYNFDDTPFFNASQAGSGRCSQSAWPGTIVAALGLGEDLEVFEAARTFTDFQMKHRHSIFYDAQGRLLRADENPWWKVGRYGLEGSYKLTLVTPAYPYEREDEQHPAAKRALTLADAYGDEAALLYCEADMECWLTRPEFRFAQMADDQRTHGYLIERVALQVLAFPEHEERLVPALLRVVDGLRQAYGVEPKSGMPYPSRAPAKTGKWSHGYPSLADWLLYATEKGLVLPKEVALPVQGGTCDHLRPWLAQKAKDTGFPSDYYTDGDQGLWGRFRAVVVWQCAVILHGLVAVRDVPACAKHVPDVGLMIRRIVACILGPGRAPGWGVFAQPMVTSSVWDAYASGFPARVVSAESEKNGTVTWLPDPLLCSLPSLGPGHVPQARELARWIWEHTDYPHELDLQVFGPVVWREFGDK